MKQELSRSMQYFAGHVRRYVLRRERTFLALYGVTLILCVVCTVFLAVKAFSKAPPTQVGSLLETEVGAYSSVSGAERDKAPFYEAVWEKFPTRRVPVVKKAPVDVREVPKARIGLSGVMLAGAESRAILHDEKGEQYVGKLGKEVLGYRIDEVTIDRVRLSRSGEEFYLVLPRETGGARAESEDSFLTRPISAPREGGSEEDPAPLSEVIDSVRLIPVRTEGSLLGGLKVRSVSEAFRELTGLYEGDVILTVNDAPLTASDGIVRAVETLRDDKAALEVSVLREGEVLAFQRGDGENELHLLTK